MTTKNLNTSLFTTMVKECAANLEAILTHYLFLRPQARYRLLLRNCSPHQDFCLMFLGSGGRPNINSMSLLDNVISLAEIFRITRALLCYLFTCLIIIGLLVYLRNSCRKSCYSVRKWRKVDMAWFLVDAVDRLRDNNDFGSVLKRNHVPLGLWCEGYSVRYSRSTDGAGRRISWRKWSDEARNLGSFGLLNIGAFLLVYLTLRPKATLQAFPKLFSS
jgi:hypothetical protein